MHIDHTLISGISFFFFSFLFNYSNYCDWILNLIQITAYVALSICCLGPKVKILQLWDSDSIHFVIFASTLNDLFGFFFTRQHVRRILDIL